MNVWESVIDYMNMNVETIGSRQHLLQHVDRYHLNRNGYTTVDCYKNYLTKAGLIHNVRVNGKNLRGKFYIPKKIPIDMSIQEVRNMAYGERLMIMGTDRATKAMCVTAGHYYIGGTNNGEYYVMRNTSDRNDEPKEPEFLSKDEMRI